MIVSCLRRYARVFVQRLLVRKHRDIGVGTGYRFNRPDPIIRQNRHNRNNRFCGDRLFRFFSKKCSGEAMEEGEGGREEWEADQREFLESTTVHSVGDYSAGEEDEPPKEGKREPSRKERISQWKRCKLEGARARVWNMGDAGGFTVYTKKRMPLFVVCETCVASGSLLSAEVKYGKDKSTTALKQHLGSRHPQLHQDLLGDEMKAKAGPSTCI